MNHLHVYISVAFGTVTVLCIYHLYLLSNHSCHPPKEGPTPIKPSLPFLLSPNPRKPFCLLSLWVYLFWIAHINGTIHYVAFCIRFLSCSIMFSRFTHGIACVSFLLMVEFCGCTTFSLSIHQLDIWKALIFLPYS